MESIVGFNLLSYSHCTSYTITVYIRRFNNYIIKNRLTITSLILILTGALSTSVVAISETQTNFGATPGPLALQKLCLM